MSESPNHAGPPTELPDEASDTAKENTPFEGKEPPFGVRYRRGEEVVEEEFPGARIGFGNGRVELIYEDGRHVTVSADELEEVK